MNIFLDTDICISILRGKDQQLITKLRSVSLALIALPSIVVAELWVGVGKSADPVNSERKLTAFLRDIPIIAFDEKAARTYGEIRAKLERKGKSIGANDLLIAATVLENGGTLITRNHGEYERVPDLQVEVW